MAKKGEMGVRGLPALGDAIVIIVLGTLHTRGVNGKGVPRRKEEVKEKKEAYLARACVCVCSADNTSRLFMVVSRELSEAMHASSRPPRGTAVIPVPRCTAGIAPPHEAAQPVISSVGNRKLLFHNGRTASNSHLRIIKEMAPFNFRRGVVVPNDDAGWRVFSGFSIFPHPCIPALRHTHISSPSPALKTSMLRAAQNSLHSTPSSASPRALWASILTARADGYCASPLTASTAGTTVKPRQVFADALPFHAVSPTTALKLPASGSTPRSKKGRSSHSLYSPARKYGHFLSPIAIEVIYRGRGGEVVRLIASHKSNRVRFPAGTFSPVEIVVDFATGQRVFSGSSRFLHHASHLNRTAAKQGDLRWTSSYWLKAAGLGRGSEGRRRRSLRVSTPLSDGGPCRSLALRVIAQLVGSRHGAGPGRSKKTWKGSGTTCSNEPLCMNLEGFRETVEDQNQDGCTGNRILVSSTASPAVCHSSTSLGEVPFWLPISCHCHWTRSNTWLNLHVLEEIWRGSPRPKLGQLVIGDTDPSCPVQKKLRKRIELRLHHGSSETDLLTNSQCDNRTEYLPRRRHQGANPRLSDYKPLSYVYAVGHALQPLSRYNLSVQALGEFPYSWISPHASSPKNFHFHLGAVFPSPLCKFGEERRKRRVYLQETDRGGNILWRRASCFLPASCSQRMPPFCLDGPGRKECSGRVGRGGGGVITGNTYTHSLGERPVTDGVSHVLQLPFLNHTPIPPTRGRAVQAPRSSSCSLWCRSSSCWYYFPPPSLPPLLPQPLPTLHIDLLRSRTG
ncbi:hypothetical protein PR048_015773 [Dryococelus australis]|uniref:Uncharacterized protein n=1 Tax=Dryococelus australis TaxID=614101 RepID=A0ABQ9HHV9_9NEOP|nr:hypothetical protein PR048_015773 [Dryococelus australis]